MRPVRSIRIEGDLAYIPLTQGYEAVIDAADVPLVEGFNWCASVRREANGEIWNVYAVRKDGPRNARRTVYLHRHITGAPDDMDVDHRDGNGLNNRRRGKSGNLRTATRSQNRQNSRIPADNTSGFKGVTWSAWARKWVANIQVARKRRHLGYFATREAAAAAYAKASDELHGEFGRVA